MIFDKRERDWQLSFGPAKGKQGRVMRFTVEPHVEFTPEKFSTGDSDVGRVVEVEIGGRKQLFAENKFEVCKENESITIAVEFLKTAMWQGVEIFGKARL